MCRVLIVLGLSSILLSDVITIGLRMIGICCRWVRFCVIVWTAVWPFSTLTPRVWTLKLLKMVLSRWVTTVGWAMVMAAMVWAPRVASVAMIDRLRIWKVVKASRLVRTLVLLLSLELVTASIDGGGFVLVPLVFGRRCDRCVCVIAGGLRDFVGPWFP